MFGDLFGGYAAREMRRTVSESRAEREERVQDQALRRRAAREAPARTAAGIKKASIFSFVAPFLATGFAFLVVRFAPHRPTAATLYAFPMLIVGAGMLAGMWALLSAITYRVRAGRGLAIASLCVYGLLVLFLLFSLPSRHPVRHVPPPQPQTQQMP